MAWKYRGPKGFISKAKYERYKHLDSYKRLSDKKWNVGGEKKAPRKTSGKPSKGERPRTPGKPEPTVSPSKIPSNPAEFEKMFDAKLKKLSKKKRAEFYQEEYEGPEYETGVDY
jgi:hypothetical protein